jgi:hypothetical protein
MEEDKRGKEHKDDPFNRLMFGPRREENRTLHQESPEREKSSHNFDGLLENFGSLMDSAQNLKPLFNKVYPLVERFLKKK